VTVRAWIEERTDLVALRGLLAHKTVPRHRYSIFYYFGGMALFLIMVQVVTGLLLLLYYEPSPTTAYESVHAISGQVPFGWLVRSIHRWSADILVGVVGLHMLTAFLMKAYRAPRELTWITGVVLFVIVLGFGFSGYLLPWDDISYFATSVGTSMAGQLPVVGDALLRLLRGGEDVTGATLSRFFALHVVYMPLALIAMLGAHLLLIQKLGMSTPPGVPLRGKPRPFLPDFALRDMVGWTLALALLAALAALFPAHTGPKADPFASAPADIRPEWYFLAPFQTLKLIPARIGPVSGEQVGIVAMVALGLLWLLVPFLDRRAARGEKSPIFTVVGFAALAYVLVMTCLALR
jgi:cytochrome b6